MNDAAKYWKLVVRVQGRVQGVMFRESTRRHAVSLGLSGWVRNLSDGSVEACFAGTREQCDQALSFVKVGPPAASVTRVETRWEQLGDRPAGEFEVR